jgi:hypothetical protein
MRLLKEIVGVMIKKSLPSILVFLLIVLLAFQKSYVIVTQEKSKENIYVSLASCIDCKWSYES